MSATSVDDIELGEAAPMVPPGTVDALCMACSDQSCDFKPVVLPRRPLGDYDVLIDMKYCGVCHSDLHKAANHNMGATQYPCVPGHELAGVCAAIGPKVTKIQVGMHVGVGCMVDSCLECQACTQGEEQKCKSYVSTYGGVDKGSGRAFSPIGYTLGGYTTKHVVHERFAIIIPRSYPLEAAGPVMCAGITMYDPLKKLGARPGTRVGIVGLGGLGVMGIKLAKALGCTVTAISRKPAKQHIATQCEADCFILSSDGSQMSAARGSLHIILNTIPVYHDYDSYTALLGDNGKQVILGLHKGIVAAFALGTLSGGCARVMHSAIGGIQNTQEVMDLCARHNIVPELQVVPCEKINEVYSKLDSANDSGQRCVPQKSTPAIAAYGLSRPLTSHVPVSINTLSLLIHAGTCWISPAL
jgi:uncharacterized zinc-type alcohol dehydrogenase-like protein